MVHIPQCHESVFMVDSHCIMFIYSVVKHWLSVVQMCWLRVDIRAGYFSSKSIMWWA